ncbi:2'-5' RNA ligase family protein [Flavobacterium sp. GA093]|uniref:2'-5' RNA ligase family protein n=1 Tax=Flavobacterium hydrocarbonoxydans TaxID=2683249 RepID=A0A6I4NJN4_9FLAO|nr:2'-5' RNA ligase family protein [Flavobacterium hydrocarbonoxydans]MWB92795.1 2'-5' RNA ligase family protein [Flavobacterium hydrocarbonoxydans]
MIKKYSVAIYPSQEVIDSVKTMKEYLKSKMGWYNSCNSTAHITICEFSMTEAEVAKIKTKLFKVCDGLTPFQIDLDHFDSYANGAFFIAPTPDSKEKLKPVMRKTQEALRLSNLKKSNDPHISIGRKLTPENLKIASQLFTTIDIDFLCDAIVLRELDPIKKQFFVIDTFSFNGNSQPELVQGSLF